MRLQNLHSRADGNAYLPHFMQDFNQRFAEEPRSSVNAHRLLTAKDDLAHTLTWQKTPSLSKNLTVQFENVVYQIQTKRPSYTLRKAVITVCVNAQQNITLLYKGQPLPYNVFHQQTKQSEVVLTKNINKMIETIIRNRPSQANSRSSLAQRFRSTAL